MTVNNLFTVHENPLDKDILFSPSGAVWRPKL